MSFVSLWPVCFLTVTNDKDIECNSYDPKVCASGKGHSQGLPSESLEFLFPGGSDKDEL